jgi:hypothetical protein
MTLIDKCTARTGGVGASSYQILCGSHTRDCTACPAS